MSHPRLELGASKTTVLSHTRDFRERYVWGSLKAFQGMGAHVNRWKKQGDVYSSVVSTPGAIRFSKAPRSGPYTPLPGSQVLLEPLASYFLENTEMPLTSDAHPVRSPVSTYARLVPPPVSQATFSFLNFEM